MESNNQQEQQPVRQSLGEGGKQKSIATIIGILVGIAAVLLVVNKVTKNDRTVGNENRNVAVVKRDKPVDNGNRNVILGNVNSSTNQNANTPANTNQPTVIDNTNQPPEVITSNVDTSNWKTYRNEELGFEVKYPALWKITTNPGDFEFVQFWKLSNDKTITATDGQAPDSAKVSISFERSSNLDEVVKDSRFDETYSVKFVKEENLSINKMRAVRLFGSAETFGSVTTVIDRGDGVLMVISGSYGFGEKQLESQVIELSNSFRTL